MSSNRTRRRAVLGAVAAAVLIAAAVGYLISRRAGRPRPPDTATYEAFARSFYSGLASLQVGLLDNAKRDYTRATELVPDEPAAWANLGLSEIRLGELDAAVPTIERAIRLAPASSEVEFLFGQLEVSRGRLEEGIAHLRRAVDLDPRSLKPRSALAQEVERAGGQTADAEAQRLFEQLIERRPDNLAVLLERTRLAVKRADAAVLQDSLNRLRRHAPSWPAVAVDQYRDLQRAAGTRSFADAARAVAFLRNVLVRVPAFREDLSEIRVPPELIADPFDRFLTLPSPTATPSPPDEASAYLQESLGAERATGWGAVIAFWPDGTETSKPVVFGADGRELRQLDPGGATWPFPGGASGAPPTGSGLLALDWNRDFKMDLAVAGRDGLRLLAQRADGTFVDRSPGAAPLPLFRADSFGVWNADIEMDGDLDLIVGVSDSAPAVLRNNADGTWRALQPFVGIVGLRAFAWGDFDHDGDPDAALLDRQGQPGVFENRQGGEFRPIESPSVRQAIALTVGDANGDGLLDLVMLDPTGTIWRVSHRIGRATSDAPLWVQQRLAVWVDFPRDAAPGTYRLFLADLDNNGALDVVASGSGRSHIWLGGERGDFRILPAAPQGEIFGVLDLDGDGQLDLVGLVDGQPARWLGRGTKGYHWHVIRPRAQEVAGDQRINAFGVGGTIEIRSGLLIQKQVLTGAPVHFGLGTRTTVDVTRIVWPNGVMQADFEHRAGEPIVAEQRLKGSCPWLFAYDGAGMRFVTDLLWRSPLGLRINAQETALVQTEDWVRIRGDQLVPRDGAYDLRITAELWETHFIDLVSLLVVDHPDEMDVFVDERFAAEAPVLAVRTTRALRPVARAWDETGQDVTELVARRDERYLATFDRGPYQGVARDHFVEVELDRREIPGDKPLWLVATGWTYPTDSSLNVAIGQGGAIRPRGLTLEAQDDTGRWIAVFPDLGFPAGKHKTILIDLGEIRRAGIGRVRRLRLRTNLEVYWDSLAIAEAVDHAPTETIRLRASAVELRYRGLSQTSGGHDLSDGSRSGPEVPLYDKLANVTQRWRDLDGYYTRFGDVRELVTAVDDRYVIMNAGDELRLRFPALPPPAKGWTRDFVLIGDGWVKDGDYNTSFSKTVLPLPSHDRPEYSATGSRSALELEDDPVYRRHAEDWQRFHTRFVSPDAFLRGLRLR